jgi:AraC-like DNA-binding protein
MKPAPQTAAPPPPRGDAHPRAALKVLVTTHGLPPRDQFECWREAACRNYRECTPLEIPRGESFAASLSGTRYGQFGVMQFDAPALMWQRQRREIAIADDESYSVTFTPPGAGLLARVNGVDCRVSPESLAVSASDSRLQVRQIGRAAKRVVKFPKTLLDTLRPAAERGRLNSYLVTADTGPGALVLGYFRTLMMELPRLEAGAAEAALHHLVGLVALQQAAAGTTRLPGQEQTRAAVRAAKLAQAQRLVDRQLEDPALDAARVAAALRISVRQLSLLFEPTGESFARYVTRRRLERAHALLLRPGAAERKVADIAFACGFDSLATFYRAFRRAYDMAPGELRA